jgi:hypothetical protein
MSLAFLKSHPKLYFWSAYLLFLIGGYFAAPLTVGIAFVLIVRRKYNLAKSTSFIIFASLIIALAFFITFLYWILLLNQWGLSNISFIIFPATIFWIVEIFHFAILVLFIISIVRVIRFPFTPYSAIYASLYNLVHVIYGGCPISELQNYLALQTETITPIDNIFWRGVFGTDPQVLNILRVVFGIISLTFLYLAYIQLNKIPVDKWTTAWTDKDFNNYNKKPTNLDYEPIL